MTREEKIIDELCRLLSDYERNQPREEAQKERYRWAVKEVTKALQEKKVGKWITEIDCGNHRHFYCPFCRNEGWGTQNYCCECGAKMGGAEE